MLLEKKIIDYVAMDIKTEIRNYDKIIGKSGYEKQVLASVELLKSSKIDYEFRTTFVKGLMTRETINGMKKIIQNSDRFVLQTVKIDKQVLLPDIPMKAFTQQEMEEFKEEFTPIVKEVRLNL